MFEKGKKNWKWNEEKSMCCGWEWDENKKDMGMRIYEHP